MPLDLSRYTSEYRKKGDIVNALAWSGIRKYLETHELTNIFPEIKSVNIKHWVLTIGTGKAIINTELKIHQEGLLEQVNEHLKVWKEQAKEVRLK